ncbi:hypothetical protein D1646_21770 [Pseudoflavonifractor sp. 60]|uniref:DMT family transporter n=1 Tax=Pseudoflavonifractor sp. 60 TaxID=2304576 RepID=UPI0013704B40|nr:DMT family transporter [Pseudoflavonifractor sp. 60]NBI69343.1 hypothetical protein [Pseudoflavonifractor sp. 60]
MKREYLFAGISILFWGSTASVMTLMADGLSSIATTFYNSLVAAGFLFFLNLFTRRLPLLRSLSIRVLLRLVALGLIGMLSVSMLLYYGLTHLKAQQAFIINYLWPILIILFAWPILGQRMTIRKTAALLLSFLGVVIVATEGDLSNPSQLDTGGVLACVLAASCYALFSVLNLKVTCDKFVATMIYYTASALVILPVLLWTEGVLALTLPQWGGVLWMGALSNGLSYATWAMAMDRGDPAKLSNLAYLTPFISLIYIFFVLHEPIHWTSLAGLFFILLGVAVQMLPKPKMQNKIPGSLASKEF